MTVKYSYKVEYNDYSSNEAGNFDTAGEAQQAGVMEAIRLAGFENKIRQVEITEYCTACDGRGKVFIETGKRVKKHVEKKCPDCKGNGERIII